MGRIESIFHKRNEDALSYAFLALLDRLTLETRNNLLVSSGVKIFNHFGNLTDVKSQVTLDDKSRPDGLLIFSDGILVFENKVLDEHDGEQLSNYYNQVAIDYDEKNVKILAAVDRDVQNAVEVKNEAARYRIEEVDIDVILWQNVYIACQNFLDSQKHVPKKMIIDIFLLEEFCKLLEEMELNELPFEGLTGVQFEAFMMSWNQLVKLERFLNKQVPQEFDFLDKYRGNDRYSSFFKEQLGFHFKKAQGKSKGVKLTYLTLILNVDNNRFEIGVRSSEERDLRKLKKKLDLRELAKEIAKLDDYLLQYGWDYENTIEGSSISEIHRSLTKASNLFTSYIRIQRAFTPEELETKFKLNTPEFPKEILNELLKLKGLMMMFNKAL
ncbi:MAG: hypothetical protein ACTSWA_08880 [Candidatus Thorarchaeota archaeon]